MHSKILLIFLLVLILASCEKTEPPPPSLLEIPVISVVQQDVPIILDMVGQTLGSRDIPIRARVDGTLESIHFLEGRVVEKGQLLYNIDTRPFDVKVVEAKGYLAEARTAKAKARSDLDRIRPLAEINAVSQQDLDSAVAKFDAAKSSMQVAMAKVEQAEIELSYASIYAPISGRIGLSKAKVGEYVGKEPNPIVLNYVSQTNPIRVRFSINERQYLKYAREIIKEIKNIDKDENAPGLELILADGSIHKDKGKVTSYEAAIDPTTGTLTLEADFPNPNSIVLAGQFARVRSQGQILTDALIVPRRAISELQGNFHVMVVNKENIIEVREVIPGPLHNNMQVVEEGLNPGDLIATEGLLRLRNGMKVIPIDKESSEKNNDRPGA